MATKKGSNKTARTGRKSAAKKTKRTSGSRSAKKRGAKKATPKKSALKTAAKKSSKGGSKKGAKRRGGVRKPEPTSRKANRRGVIISSNNLAIKAASPCPPGMEPVEEFFQDENGNQVVRIVCRPIA